MHELSLATDLIEQASTIAIANGANRIDSIRLKMGPLSGVVKESLLFCFSEASKGTVAQGAALLIEETKLLVKCHRCQKESEVTPHCLICTICHLPDVTIVSGKEFRMIDMEVS